MMDTMIFDGSTFGNPEPHNLCDFFGAGHNVSKRLYFDKSAFPPPGNTPKRDSLKDLQRAIRSAAHS